MVLTGGVLILAVESELGLLIEEPPVQPFQLEYGLAMLPELDNGLEVLVAGVEDFSQLLSQLLLLGDEEPQLEDERLPKPELELPKPLERPELLELELELPKLERLELPKPELPKLERLELPKLELPKLERLEPKLELPKLERELPKLELPKLEREPPKLERELLKLLELERPPDPQPADASKASGPVPIRTDRNSGRIPLMIDWNDDFMKYSFISKV